MSNKGRGKPKTSLRHLSRQHPTTEETEALVQSLYALPPVAAAIMGATLVEYDLERMLRARLPRQDDAIWDDLTEDRGPIGTLSQKIALAHALKIIPDNIKKNLTAVRHVRNVFAHAKKPVPFNHPLILAELRKVGGTPRKRFGIFKSVPNTLSAEQAQRVYVSLCIRLSTTMMSIEMMKRKKADRNRTWRQSRKQAPTNALSRYLQANPDKSLLGRAPSRDHQNGDPKSEELPSNFLSRYARALEKKGRNGDK